MLLVVDCVQTQPPLQLPPSPAPAGCLPPAPVIQRQILTTRERAMCPTTTAEMMDIVLSQTLITGELI